MMTDVLTFDELTARVLSMAIDQTSRETIELGVIQGFCLDLAEDLSPDLVPVLTSITGLELLVATLEHMPDFVTLAATDKSMWKLVRHCSPRAHVGRVN